MYCSYLCCSALIIATTCESDSYTKFLSWSRDSFTPLYATPPFFFFFATVYCQCYFTHSVPCTQGTPSILDIHRLKCRATISFLLGSSTIKLLFSGLHLGCANCFLLQRAANVKFLHTFFVAVLSFWTWACFLFLSEGFHCDILHTLCRGICDINWTKILFALWLIPVCIFVLYAWCFHDVSAVKVTTFFYCSTLCIVLKIDR